MVRETVKDEGVIGLIRKFLKSGVMVEGLVSQIRATTLTNKYLEGLGFPNLVKRYELLREQTRVREMLMHGTC